MKLFLIIRELWKLIKLAFTPLSSKEYKNKSKIRREKRYKQYLKDKYGY